VCSDAKKLEYYNEKKASFDYIVKRVLNSPIRLSNWGIWEQIENYKSALNLKSKDMSKDTQSYKAYLSITDYLNSYEKKFLDLR